MSVTVDTHSNKLLVDLDCHLHQLFVYLLHMAAIIFFLHTHISIHNMSKQIRENLLRSFNQK